MAAIDVRIQEGMDGGDHRAVGIRQLILGKKSLSLNNINNINHVYLPPLRDSEQHINKQQSSI